MRRVLIVMAFALALLAARRAAASGLTADEQRRLARGEVVRRHTTVELERGRYVGGVSYAIVEAPTAVVMAALSDVATYRTILPLTLEARQLRRRGRDSLVFFRHGGRLGTAAYVAHVRRESPRLVRFWLDPSFPHDFDDAWGYFRVTPLGARGTLVTYAALVNLGFGLTRLLFEEKVREHALGTPGLIRAFVEDRSRG